MSENMPGAEELKAAANEFMRRMTQGMAALANMREVTIGSVAKDAVFRKDKLTLYRYRPSEVVAPDLRVRTPLLGHSIISMPYMNYGGPLGTPAARRTLLEAAVLEAGRSKASVLQTAVLIRPRRPTSGM